MSQSLTLQDASVSISEQTCQISCAKLSLAFSFDREFGFTLNALQNHSGKRTVSYVNHPQPFTPFLLKKPQAEGTEEPTPRDPSEFDAALARWQYLGADAREILYGGVKALELSAKIASEVCGVTLHVIAFPTCSIVRYYFEIENLAPTPSILRLNPCSMRLYIDSPRDIFRAHWFNGAHVSFDFGRKFEQAFGAYNNKKLSFASHMTADYVPLVVFTRDYAPNDGIMIQMDYTANWSAHIDREGLDMLLDFRIEDQDGTVSAEPGEIISMPPMTLAVFADSLDGLMVETFDWQYKYMWDYTANDYFAKTREDSASHRWVYCSRILNEQFAYRLVGMDMLGIRNFMQIGHDIDWDDAGWSAFPGWPDNNYGSVFRNNYEGPDHRLSTRYFKKNGIKRLLWFAGKPSNGLLNTKHGAWGEFEWRTDGLSNWSLKDEQLFKKSVTDYLDTDPRRSFHTCAGGARYALTFDIQRYANFHYSADCGCGPCSNYYYTYFTLPDKWGDMPQAMLGGHTYAKDASFTGLTDLPAQCYAADYARNRLSMVPNIAPGIDQNVPFVRKDLEIYRYFLEQGLAGKWSYMFHPGVYGDDEMYYLQRTSHDRLRACIIIRRKPENRVLLFPTGLLPDASYTITFAESEETFTKLGQDLMENGIVLKDPPAGQLIYFNLPTAPGKSATAPTPHIPSAFKMPENNVGVSGIGIYWCADTNETQVRLYEIARNGEVIGSVAKARYYFDYDAGWDPDAVYTVRAIGAADNPSEWQEAKPLPSSALLVYSSLGDHGENFGVNGWSAETSTDLRTFTPMKWTAPVRFPGADFGGTPNQVGGIEGYFEGGLCAKVGRGWFQASPDVYCVKSFTAPRQGTLTLTGRAVKEWYHSEYGSPVTVCVLKNTETLVPPYTLQCGEPNGLSYNETFAVEKGDVIRFVVGMCDAERNETTHFEQNANIIGWNTILSYNRPDATAEDPFVCRINCGGETITDEAGARWEADRFFEGGTAASCTETVKGRNPALYATSRIAPVNTDLTYRIPVPSGVYAVRLCFAETELAGSCERFMRVVINGSVCERELDIAHDIRAVRTAFTKVYSYLVPDAEGFLTITLSASLGGVCLNGIEVVEENDDICHINCGGEDFVDWAGYVWNADHSYEGGEVIYEPCPDLRQASPTLYDKPLYFSGRSGKDFSYHIPVKEGIYSVQLKFAELSLTTPNLRPIDIYINDYKVKENRDALADAGEQPMTADLRFDDISSANGMLHIRIVAKGDYPAILRAIEID